MGKILIHISLVIAPGSFPKKFRNDLSPRRPDSKTVSVEYFQGTYSGLYQSNNVNVTQCKSDPHVEWQHQRQYSGAYPLSYLLCIQPKLSVEIYKTRIAPKACRRISGCIFLKSNSISALGRDQHGRFTPLLIYGRINFRYAPGNNQSISNVIFLLLSLYGFHISLT